MNALEILGGTNESREENARSEERLVEKVGLIGGSDGNGNLSLGRSGEGANTRDRGQTSSCQQLGGDKSAHGVYNGPYNTTEVCMALGRQLLFFFFFWFCLKTPRGTRFVKQLKKKGRSLI
jgi:hypothetical protein